MSEVLARFFGDAVSFRTTSTTQQHGTGAETSATIAVFITTTTTTAAMTPMTRTAMPSASALRRQ